MRRCKGCWRWRWQGRVAAVWAAAQALTALQLGFNVHALDTQSNPQKLFHPQVMLCRVVFAKSNTPARRGGLTARTWAAGIRCTPRTRTRWQTPAADHEAKLVGPGRCACMHMAALGTAALPACSPCMHLRLAPHRAGRPRKSDSRGRCARMCPKSGLPEILQPAYNQGCTRCSPRSPLRSYKRSTLCSLRKCSSTSTARHPRA